VLIRPEKSEEKPQHTKALFERSTAAACDPCVLKGPSGGSKVRSTRRSFGLQWSLLVELALRRDIHKGRCASGRPASFSLCTLRASDAFSEHLFP
jgi:hypothetical protein